ncbi:mitochondrial import inner membrane translocase subunit Tim21 isoform X2 [Aquarana catesbeiana]|uniref:mitochondrial import inner membrane translocase subunit Tim21 isoform X2 n=1 Tax=Aquarana catesbeiana TaxID=8400 RepID=UPI003CC98854
MIVAACLWRGVVGRHSALQCVRRGYRAAWASVGCLDCVRRRTPQIMYVRSLCTGRVPLTEHKKQDGGQEENEELAEFRKGAFLFFVLRDLIYPSSAPKIYKRALKKCENHPEFPSTPQEWQTVASHFAQQWDFPNCGGAIDGKYVHIIPPPNSGLYYFNYKGFNSIVMLAVVSANYDFLYVDVGKNGRMSDGGVIAQTEFYRRLQNGSLDLPAPEDNVEGLPFVFVADEAFALGDHLMRPFPMRTLTPEQRVFNYRLARARRVVENTFGILASRFCLFLTPIHMAEYKLNHIIMACCILSNFLRKHSANYACSVGPEAGVIPETTLTALESGRPGLPSLSARDVRLRYLEFFAGRGAINMPSNL